MELIKNWDWEQLTSISKFRWEVGVTPFSDLWVVFGFMAAYLIVIFGLQAWMKNRKPFEMLTATRVHNVILCVWSLSMCIGTIIPAYRIYQAHGARALWCGITKDTPMMVGLFGYWRYHYYLSKFYELLDTVILVLKKKNLIFLHVYHHAIMLYISWIWIAGNYTTAWWGVMTNTLVHVFMYYYYFVSTMGYSPWWKRYITSGQIVQFVAGILYATVQLYEYYATNGNCGGDIRFAWVSQGVALSFLFLFINFYVQTYTKGRAQRRPEGQKPKNA
jgi:fatty acid elongase 3